MSKKKLSGITVDFMGISSIFFYAESFFFDEFQQLLVLVVCYNIKYGLWMLQHPSCCWIQWNVHNVPFYVHFTQNQRLTSYFYRSAWHCIWEGKCSANSRVKNTTGDRYGLEWTKIPQKCVCARMLKLSFDIFKEVTWQRILLQYGPIPYMHRTYM